MFCLDLLIIDKFNFDKYFTSLQLFFKLCFKIVVFYVSFQGRKTSEELTLPYAIYTDIKYSKLIHILKIKVAALN